MQLDKKSNHSFSKGFGSVFNLFPCIHLPERFNETDNDSFSIDAKALNLDWENVGNDMNNALRKYDQNSKKDITS